MEPVVDGGFTRLRARVLLECSDGFTHLTGWGSNGVSRSLRRLAVGGWKPGTWLALGLTSLGLACQGSGPDQAASDASAPPADAVPSMDAPATDASIDVTIEAAPDAATSTCASMVVGPAGGTLNHPAGASVSVPVGALVTATSLSLCTVAAPSASTLGATPLGQAFQAGPEGQTFLKPVTVTVPFQSALLPSGATTVGVRTAPQGDTTFVALESQANLASGIVVATTVHFSQFVPATPGSTLAVTPAPTLPNGTVGAQYGQVLDVTGGTAPYTFTVAPESTLPTGLGLTADGYIAGVPTTVGVYAFFIDVSDSSGQSVEVGEAMTVVEATSPTPVLTSVTPSSAAAGSGRFDDCSLARASSRPRKRRGMGCPLRPPSEARPSSARRSRQAI